METKSVAAVPPASAGWEEDGARYAVDSLLGRGGMGEVRLALDRRIGREVALKTVRDATGPSDAERVRERFLWEACIQGQLEHPSIVPVYDLARSASGELYFTMKRVRGRTLRGILDALRSRDAEMDAAFPPHKLLGAFQSVCLAVAFAHSRGIVHRDLKPDNIMLGDFGEVYVLDWGIAKVLGRNDPTHLSVLPPSERSATSAGSILGTLGYMAPEQLRSSDAVDEGADVYALGAMLFELLTLEWLHPVDPEKVVHSTLAGVDVRERLRAIGCSLPSELVDACAVALAPRAERDLSARGLHDELERYLSRHRGVELRREMSRHHATTAAEAAARALDGRDARDDRRQALQEAGRALALDPTNEHAAQTIMKLLVTPPQEQPTEVRRQLADKDQARGKYAMRVASVSYAALLFYVPLLMWMGVADYRMLAVLLACIVFVAGYSFALSKRPKLGDGAMLVACAANALVVGATAFALGPFVITPAFAAVTTLVTALHFERNRPIVIGMGFMALCIPLVLEWAGVLPASYQFVEGGMLIRERMVALSELPTLLLLIVSSFTTLAISAVAGARIGDELTSAERRLMVQAWQLQQLLPAAAERESVNPVRPFASQVPPASGRGLSLAETALDPKEAGPCLCEDDIVDLMQGRASDSVRRRMEQHMDSCRSCRELVSLMARNGH